AMALGLSHVRRRDGYAGSARLCREAEDVNLLTAWPEYFDGGGSSRDLHAMGFEWWLRCPDKTDRTRVGGSAVRGGPRRRPHRDHSCLAPGNPRVEVEAHARPTTVTRAHRLRPNPAQLFEALERVLHHPRLRQPRPLVAVDLPGGEWTRQPAVRELGRQHRRRHAPHVSDRRIDPARVRFQVAAPRDRLLRGRPGDGPAGAAGDGIDERTDQGQRG